MTTEEIIQKLEDILDNCDPKDQETELFEEIKSLTWELDCSLDY